MKFIKLCVLCGLIISPLSTMAEQKWNIFPSKELIQENDRLKTENANLRRERHKHEAACRELLKIANLLNIDCHHKSVDMISSDIQLKLKKNHYTLTDKLNDEELSYIHKVLARDHNVLRIIKNYHTFIQSLVGKKIIVIPEN